MPVEYVLLKDSPPPFAKCPNCGGEPFNQFLRGQVQRPRRSFFGLGRKRAYCAVICYDCTEIVGYETPPPGKEVNQ